LSYRPGRKSWGRLDRKLALAHERPNSPLVAFAILRGWVDQMGLCYHNVRHHHAYQNLSEVARKHGFDEIPGPAEVKEWSPRACAGWGRRGAGRNGRRVGASPPAPGDESAGVGGGRWGDRTGHSVVVDAPIWPRQQILSRPVGGINQLLGPTHD